MSEHIGETGVVYSKIVARIATSIIARVHAIGVPELRDAIYGIVRLAESDPGHMLTLRVIEEKLQACGVTEKERIESFFQYLKELDDIVQFVPPTTKDSKYMYRFLGFEAME